jgi:hypothetical protein
VGEFKSAPECAGALKAQVRADENQGAKAVFDERNGMMAITVRLTKQASRGSDPVTPPLDVPSAASADAGSAAPAEKSIATSSDGSIRRVRNLECRSARRMEKLSRAQRALREIGLSS